MKLNVAQFFDDNDVLTRYFEMIMSLSFTTVKWYEITYEKIVEQEIRHTNITEDCNLLFVGGGAVPYTGYLVAKKVGCKTTILDKDKLAIRLAKKASKKFHPELNLEFVCGCAEKFSGYSEFDIVFCAQHLDNKMSVVKRLMPYLIKKDSDVKKVVFRRTLNNDEKDYPEYIIIEFLNACKLSSVRKDLTGTGGYNLQIITKD
jgi:precorrin-6B methylase 2